MTDAPRTTLGSSDLSVSPLNLGGNVFGWTADENTSFEVLDAYVAAGGNFIDTADVYSAWNPGNSGGESETIIGKWMKDRGNRSEIVVATKVGMLTTRPPNSKGKGSVLLRSRSTSSWPGSIDPRATSVTCGAFEAPVCRPWLGRPASTRRSHCARTAPSAESSRSNSRLCIRRSCSLADLLLSEFPGAEGVA